MALRFLVQLACVSYSASSQHPKSDSEMLDKYRIRDIRPPLQLVLRKVDQFISGQAGIGPLTEISHHVRSISEVTFTLKNSSTGKFFATPRFRVIWGK